MSVKDILSKGKVQGDPVDGEIRTEVKLPGDVNVKYIADKEGNQTIRVETPKTEITDNLEVGAAGQTTSNEHSGRTTDRVEFSATYTPDKLNSETYTGKDVPVSGKVSFKGSLAVTNDSNSLAIDPDLKYDSQSKTLELDVIATGGTDNRQVRLDTKAASIGGMSQSIEGRFGDDSSSDTSSVFEEDRVVVKGLLIPDQIEIHGLLDQGVEYLDGKRSALSNLQESHELNRNGSNSDFVDSRIADIVASDRRLEFQEITSVGEEARISVSKGDGKWSYNESEGDTNVVQFVNNETGSTLVVNRDAKTYTYVDAEKGQVEFNSYKHAGNLVDGEIEGSFAIDTSKGFETTVLQDGTVLIDNSDGQIRVSPELATSIGNDGTVAVNYIDQSGERVDQNYAPPSPPFENDGMRIRVHPSGELPDNLSSDEIHFQWTGSAGSPREQLAELKGAATNIPEQPDSPKHDFGLDDEQKDEAQQDLDEMFDENDQALQEQTEQGIKDEVAGNLEDSIKAGLLIDPSTIEPDWQLNEDDSAIEDDSYSVVEGDTVSTVMARMGLDYNNAEERAAFMESNGLTDENVNDIGIGDELVRPDENTSDHSLSIEERAAREGMSVEDYRLAEQMHQDYDYLVESGAVTASLNGAGNSPTLEGYKEWLEQKSKPQTDAQIAGVSEERWGEIQQEAHAGVNSGISNLLWGLENDSNTQVAIGALELLINNDILSDSFNLIPVEYQDNFQGATQAVSAGFRLEGALDADNEFGAIDAGIDFLEGLDNALGNDKLGELGNLNEFNIGGTGVNVGQALSIINLGMAIDSGDAQAILNSGMQTFQAFGGKLPGPLGYADAIFKLADGDIEGAAVSAATTYLMTLGPWGVAAAVVLSIVGMGSPPPPQAEAEFVRGPDGKLTIRVTGNNDDFKDSVEEVGDAYADWFNAFEESLPDGRKIDTELFASYEMAQNPDGETYRSIKYDLNGNGTGESLNLIEEDTDVGQMLYATAVTNVGLQMLLDGSSGHDIAGWDEAGWADYKAQQGQAQQVLDEGGLGRSELYQNIHEGVFQNIYSQARPPQAVHEFFNNLDVGVNYSVYPFGAPNPATLNKVMGIGVFAGGGNVGGSQELVEVTAEDIETDSEYIPRELQQEFEEVKKTWRTKGNIFAGEYGQLLAIALATGQLTWSELVEAGLLVDPEQEVLPVDEAQQQRLLEILKQVQNDNNGETLIVPGRGVFGSPKEPHPGTPTDEFSEAYSPYYGRRPQGDELEQEPEEILNQVQDDNSEGNNNSEQAEQIRALFDEQPELVTPDLSNNNVQQVGGEILNQVQDDSLGGVLLQQAPASKGVADSFNILEDRHFYTSVDELLKNDAESATFGGIGGASHGQVSIDANNDILFIPDANYFGAASFSYSINVGGVTESVMVNLNVVNVDDAPITDDDALTKDEDTRINLKELLGNDQELDNEALRIAGVSQVSVGQITIDGSGEYFFEPPADFVGDVEFIYVAQDTAGSSSLAKAKITLNELENDVPQVVLDAFDNAVEDTAYVFNTASLIANDKDPEGNALIVTDVQAVSGGTLNWNQATGDVTFTPTANFNGTAQIQYTVVDDPDPLLQQTSTGNASIVFAAVDDAFTTGDHAITINEDAVTILTPAFLLSKVSNDDDLPIEISAVRMVGGTNGNVVLLPDGTVQFIPADQFNGNAAFEVRISDGNADHETRIISRVDVTILPQNDAPEAVEDFFNTGVEETLFKLKSKRFISQ